MGTVTKGKLAKDDVSLWNGTSTRTVTRTTSQSYSMSLQQFDWVGVDVFQKYGGGSNKNSTAIAAALSALSAVTADLALWFAPGTWSLTQNHTFGANLHLVMAPGAVFDTDMSIRSSTYKWTRSGSGTGEYYLEASAGGTPSLSEPAKVIENGTAMTVGTMGSLSASYWDWGDNDSLGYNTVYVRLADDADPDEKSAGYVLAAYTLTVNGDLIAPNCSITTGYGEINLERQDTDDHSTSGTGEDTMASSSVPANFMGTTGGIKVRAVGTKTGGNGNKTIKFYFGSTSITVHPANNNAHDWQFEADIFNTALNAQRIRWQFIDGDRDVMSHYAGYETGTEDTSAAVTIKMTGECAHASDTITQTMWIWGRA